MNGQQQLDQVSTLLFSKEDIGAQLEQDADLQQGIMPQDMHSINKDLDVVAIQNLCSNHFFIVLINSLYPSPISTSIPLRRRADPISK